MFLRRIGAVSFAVRRIPKVRPHNQGRFSLVEMGLDRMRRGPRQEVRHLDDRGVPRDSSIEGQGGSQGGCRKEAPDVLLLGPEEQKTILRLERELQGWQSGKKLEGSRLLSCPSMGD